VDKLQQLENSNENKPSERVDKNTSGLTFHSEESLPRAPWRLWGAAGLLRHGETVRPFWTSLGIYSAWKHVVVMFTSFCLVMVLHNLCVWSLSWFFNSWLNGFGASLYHCFSNISNMDF
jgi:hypothetical protein